jgi:hypothetical protein
VLIGAYWFLTRPVLQDFKDFSDLDSDYDVDPHRRPDLGSYLGVMKTQEKMEKFLAAY